MPSGRSLETTFRVNVETQYVNTSDQLNPNNVRDNLKYIEIAKRLANGFGINKANLQHYSRRRLINSTEIINLDGDLTNRWGDQLNFDEIKLGVIFNRQEEENRFLEVNIKDEKYYIGPEGYRIFWEPSDIGLVDASSSEPAVGNMVVSSNADIEYDLILIGSGAAIVDGASLWLSPDFGVDNATDVAATDGQTVLNYTDIISSRIFTQSTEAKKPLFQTAGINGRPVLSFNGTDNLLVLSENFITGSKGSVFVVLNMAATIKTDQTILGSSDEAGGVNFVTLRSNRSTGTRANIAVVPPDDNLDALTTSPLLAGTTYLMVWLSNGSKTRMRINGVEQTLSEIVGSNNGNWFSSPVGIDNVTIGAHKRNIETSFFKGIVGDIIVYDDVVLSSEDIDENEATLASKYGIVLGS